MNDTSSLCPLLVVRGAAQAIDFYQRGLGARVLARYEHGPQRRLSHADLALGAARFSLTEEPREWNSDAPVSLGGSAVVLQLAVPDADGAVAQLCAAGASVVFPLQTFAGERMARVRDPFGHLWLLHQLLEQPSEPLSREPLSREPLSRKHSQRYRDELLAGQSLTTAPAAAKDALTIGSATAPGQAPSAAPPAQAGVHLVLGPVGAGKSTFARQLAQQRSALRLTLDDWMTTLFSPDRPQTGLFEWYAPRARRCVEQIWKVALQLTARGEEVVLELGLLRREQREDFYALVAAADLPLTRAGRGSRRAARARAGAQPQPGRDVLDGGAAGDLRAGQ
jgi:uncharacterized glyoxalase superfamily protein PhnB/predicted kinase